MSKRGMKDDSKGKGCERREKVQPWRKRRKEKGPASLSGAAAAFCWLNGKTEERKAGGGMKGEGREEKKELLSE